jgi:glutamate/tyrosine decarboxylase-like PLP-dependent enzyme
VTDRELGPELSLIAEADRRARAYLAASPARPVFPPAEALAGLDRFDVPLPERGSDPAETLELLDAWGSPATTVSNGSRYFGYVIGASLPVAAAAERLLLAWDQSGASFETSPAAATIEATAARWVLDVLGLPRDSAVGFGTGASACTLTALATARRAVLARAGWDLTRLGLRGSPAVRFVVPELVHGTVRKALRVLGVGERDIAVAPVDATGAVDPGRFPALGGCTVVVLQAGEVNTGAVDPFDSLIPLARDRGAWVHVDGAFGLWARASRRRALLAGVEGADSWTVDAHKWLNTPYDGGMTIVRDAGALTATTNSDAAYAAPDPTAQRNLTLEFSRRPRGVSVWAALHSLGRQGVAELVDRTIDLAQRVGTQLAAAGFAVLSPVVLNQVLFRGDDAAATRRLHRDVARSGRAWLSLTQWADEPALRISVSSWRTQSGEVDDLVALLVWLRTRDRTDRVR